jgi:hypothetical protein
VPIDLALYRYGPPKLVAELVKLEAAAQLAAAQLKDAKVFPSDDLLKVWDYRERIWRALCGEVEQDRYCISHLSSEPKEGRRIFPSDRCWYLKLPRTVPFDECSDFMRAIGLHGPGPHVLEYLDRELRDVLIHPASAMEADARFWLAGQMAPPTTRATRAWAATRGYSQPAVEKIVTDVFGTRTAGRRRRSL